METEQWFEMSHSDFDAKRNLLGLFPDYEVGYINPLVITLSQLRETYKVHISILHPILKVNDLMPENLDIGEYYNITKSTLIYRFDIFNNSVIIIHFEMDTMFKLLNII